MNGKQGNKVGQNNEMYGRRMIGQTYLAKKRSGVRKWGRSCHNGAEK